MASNDGQQKYGTWLVMQLLKEGVLKAYHLSDYGSGSHGSNARSGFLGGYCSQSTNSMSRINRNARVGL